MALASTLSRRLDRQHWPRPRPGLGALAVVAVAWAALAASFALSVLARPAGPGRTAMTGVSGMAAMPGMAGTSGMTASAAGFPGAVLAAWHGLPGWTLMCVAMMGPAALTGIRHTGQNSLRRRRGRAMAEFAAGYLGVWAGSGVIALSLSASPLAGHGLVAFAALLALAAAWELTPVKRRALRECDRSRPLPLRGWRAEKGAAVFGARQGLWCVCSCWCLMLAVLAAPGYGFPWMIALTGLVTAERVAKRPLRVTRFAAGALLVAAVLVINVALNLRAYG